MSEAETCEGERPGGSPGLTTVSGRAFLVSLVVAAGAFLPVLSAGSARRDSRPAAIIATIEGTVWVTSVHGERALASVGQRLTEGDEVRTDEGGRASIYFSGGHIVRVPGGNRLEVIRDPATQIPAVSPAARMSRAAVKIVDEGLWVVTDPTGRLLLTGMRGGDREVEDPPGETLPLSPRNEVVIGSRPTFHWTAGAEPVRVAVGTTRDIIWKGDPTSAGSVKYPRAAPELSPDTEYVWWLEEVMGTLISERVAFRVVSTGSREEVQRVENELDRIEAEERSLGEFLRCAYYVGLESWSQVIVAAHRLHAIDPDSEYASYAMALAERRMSITRRASRALVERLSN